MQLLKELSDTFPKDKIIFACDGAAWHKSGGLIIPENIGLIFFAIYEELICLSIEDADAERQRIIDSCELIGRIESVIDSVYMPKNSLEANFAGVEDEIYKSGNEYYLVFNSPLESNGRYTYAQKLSIDE